METSPGPSERGRPLFSTARIPEAARSLRAAATLAPPMVSAPSALA